MEPFHTVEGSQSRPRADFPGGLDLLESGPRGRIAHHCARSRVNLSSAPRSMDRRANTLTTQPKDQVPVLMPGIRRHTSLEHMARTGFVPDRIPITRAWSWIAPWVEAFIDQLATFPNAAHDDQVDAFSQALNRMSLVKIAPKVVLPLPPVPGGDRGWMT